MVGQRVRVFKSSPLTRGKRSVQKHKVDLVNLGLNISRLTNSLVVFLPLDSGGVESSPISYLSVHVFGTLQFASLTEECSGLQNRTNTV